jgi:hypothetical protein
MSMARLRKTHPYKNFEGSVIWRAVEKAILALARNGDIKEPPANTSSVRFAAPSQADDIQINSLSYGLILATAGKQSCNCDENDCTHSSGRQAAPESKYPDSQALKNPSADHGPDEPEDNVNDASKSASASDCAGQPTRD